MQKLSLKGFERGKVICIALRLRCKNQGPLYDLNANDTNFCPTEGVHLVAQEFVPRRGSGPGEDVSGDTFIQLIHSLSV
jgi:hypothetical protein